jgi:hypothetical protein
VVGNIVLVRVAPGFVMECETFDEYVAPRRMIWGRQSQRISKT